MDPSMLMAGPRGRRLLMQFALGADDEPDVLSQRVGEADVLFDPDTRGSRVSTLHEPTLADRLRRFVAYLPLPDTARRRPASEPDPAAAHAAATRVADALDETALADVTWDALGTALSNAVSVARYWQPLDGIDVLLARDEMRGALMRVARHVAASEAAAWWTSPVDVSSQHTMLWDGDDPVPPVDRERTSLLAARQHVEDAGHSARADGSPIDVSGEWWSSPRWPAACPHTARLAPDGSPLAALLVEDSLGWEDGESIELVVPDGLRIFEIASADAWADLCRRYPVDVSAQKRGDWFSTTGRDGAWVMPDWAAVAGDYDGVHLPVAAYLAIAGRAIPVSDEAASVVAGWDPDHTYWLTDRVRYTGERERWVERAELDRYAWERAEPLT